MKFHCAQPDTALLSVVSRPRNRATPSAPRVANGSTPPCEPSALRLAIGSPTITTAAKPARTRPTMPTTRVGRSKSSLARMAMPLMTIPTAIAESSRIDR